MTRSPLARAIHIALSSCSFVAITTVHAQTTPDSTSGTPAATNHSLAVVSTPSVAALGDSNRLMQEMVVTTTGEAKTKDELAESVGVLNQDTLENVMPAHPSEALNRIAGVYVNNLGGEGHMTSIRQPLTTQGVYLFLEDGIPTRPTGFLNHNGLYEVNVAQSSQVEVTKGPGSALYGSDAVGGVINSLTRKPSDSADADISLEVGSDGWQRALLSGSGAINDNHRVGVQLNLTESDGYRDEAGYERTSLNGRWDYDASDSLSAKTVISYTDVHQDGASSLKRDDYLNAPQTNYYQGEVGYRDVESLRISSEWNYQPNEDQLLSVTPFYRNNSMELMPSWMLTYDPNILKNEFETYGLQTRYRQYEWDQSVLWIVGLDVDYTPAEYQERRINPIQNDQGIYVDYTFTGRTNYHYEAEQLSLSPYLHTEWQVNDAWRLSAGLRYDHFSVDYQDQLDPSVPEFGVFDPIPWPTTHLRPEDQEVSFDQWSPKLSAIYAFTTDQEAYVNYRHAFRAPTVGRLFRSGSTTNSDELEPVKADSVELGFRGLAFDHGDMDITYELALYHMEVRDDIVSFIDNTTRDRKSANAGETRHQGIEIAFDAHFNDEWSSVIAFSYTNQTYVEFETLCGRATCDYSGNDIARAPKTLGNWTLAYTPNWSDGLRIEAEWNHLGDYYTDQTNTQKYDGHDLFNLRANYDINDNFGLFLRVQNLNDKTYSTYTSNAVGSDELDYRPGLPRSVFAGVKYHY